MAGCYKRAGKGGADDPRQAAATALVAAAGRAAAGRPGAGSDSDGPADRFCSLWLPTRSPVARSFSLSTSSNQASSTGPLLTLVPSPGYLLSRKLSSLTPWPRILLHTHYPPLSL